MELGERKLQILQAIIDDYIVSAEPVGSRTISKKYGIGLSSATIRNEMADLEDMGYLEQPHTSSGRIPSDKGYRLYVDHLMKTKVLTITEANHIKDLYEKKTRQIEQVIFQTSRILSDITNYTAIVSGPKLSLVRVKHIQLVPIDNHFALLVVVTNTGIIKDTIVEIPEGITGEYLYRISNMLNDIFKDKSLGNLSLETVLKMKEGMVQDRVFFNSLVDALTKSVSIKDSGQVYLGGATNIFNFPEYHDILKAKEFLDLMEQKDLLYKLLIRPQDEGVSIVIGEENQYEELREYSIVTATYNIGGGIFGTLGIIGPTRMEYSKTVPIMDFMSCALSTYLKDLFTEE
ncbi:MAG TPA: heat-inducible transcriptional repressor HrcA [Clostridia bacterium]|nr:heat-inducible transcriptional repressor HrcA [Clostridia bacterium]